MIELKDVKISIEQGDRKVAIGSEESVDGKIRLKAEPGRITMIRSCSDQSSRAILLSMMGLWPTVCGYVSFDGEIVQPATRETFTDNYAYVPRDLSLGAYTIGYVLDVIYTNDENTSPRSGIKKLYNELSKFQIDKNVVAEPFDKLSPSIKRMVSIAAILSSERNVIMLDSPTIDIEETDRQALMSRLRQLASEGRTIVISSADKTLESKVDVVYRLKETYQA